jgi:hypothetical protein
VLENVAANAMASTAEVLAGCLKMLIARMSVLIKPVLRLVQPAKAAFRKRGAINRIDAAGLLSGSYSQRDVSEVLA